MQKRCYESGSCIQKKLCHSKGSPHSSRRRSCPGGERGDRQSSVPADPTPSRASPTGRRIGGYDYKNKANQQSRAEKHTDFRKMGRWNFFVVRKTNYQTQKSA